MKIKLELHLLFLGLLSLPVFAHAQGTAIGYQGRLNGDGQPATGFYDFTFNVFDVEADGAALAGNVALDAVPVTNGLFNVMLDFGPDIFTGPARWLEITVRTNGVGAPSILAPRTPVHSIPYAMFAGSAGNVADRTVTANHLNTGGLAPTPGQFLSYDGGNLLWSDPGAAVGDVWSRNGADAYFNAGKVGIGTMAPTTPVEANGIVRSTRSGVAPQYIQLNGGDSGSIKLTAQSTVAAEKILFIENLSGEATPGANNSMQFVLGTTAARSAKMTITKDGNVLLPLGGTGGGITIGTPNSETGISIVGAVGRADLRFDDTTVKLVAGPVGAPPSSASGIAITTGGNVGIGTTTPGAKLHTETSQANTAAIYGNATGTGGVGVYGKGASGTAVFADGNARQTRDKGGFAKAMLFVEADGTISRCYNGVTGSSANGCGFSVRFVQSGPFFDYVVTFPFKVSDRFVTVTTGSAGSERTGANIRYFDNVADENSLGVGIFVTNHAWEEGNVHASFTLILY